MEVSDWCYGNNNGFDFSCGKFEVTVENSRNLGGISRGILKGEVCQSLRNHLHTYISSSTMRKIIVDIDEAVAIVDKGYSEIKRKGCSKNLVGLSAFRRQEEEVLLKDVARKRRASVVHFHIKANEKNKGGVGS